MPSFPFFKQFDTMDCGPTCLRMIAKHFGKNYSLQTLREKSGINKEGVSMAGIGMAAEQIGFRTLVAKVTFEKLVTDAPLPFIAHWKQNHFVVVHAIKKDKVFVADPGIGLVEYSIKDFKNNWVSSVNNVNEQTGIVMLFETTPKFFLNDEDKQDGGLSFRYIFNYLFTYKSLLIQIAWGLLMGGALQLVLPFLTQSIIDVGINTRNLSFINLILLGQFVLYFGRSVVEFIRGWIFLHIGSRINISILSDFFIKLLRLPISYFDTKFQGDLLQRIGDHEKIESFLTNTVISTIYGVFNFIIFSIVLSIFNLKIFLMFLVGSILYVLWIWLFLGQRKILNNRSFDIASKSQTATLQIIDGIQEIKLTNSEQQKRWDWENIQASLFRLNMKGLGLSQIQSAGAMFINEGKNIFITYLTARAVIEGEMTLGMMLSVGYILGMLNGPIEQFIHFIQDYQDAKLSLERLNDIHKVEDEEPVGKQRSVQLSANKTLAFTSVSFKYPGTSRNILDNIDFVIPQGKTTAIVGTSGSGKTTILKLLLKFYAPAQGQIIAGNTFLSGINHNFWRSRCGAVLQDGFVFSDTIARNIAVGEDFVDINRLNHAAHVANIAEFVEALPLGYNTKIGAEGNGLSQGQKQRLLIARAVYKDPDYIFFDEATNALDANNEKIIMENLTEFFKGRTVIVVAHRLSTVKNADQIVVLEQGRIVEKGTHEQLTHLRGYYYALVKNQLELGN
jgi:ATP-binding cassette, subfamily B, bacterial